MIMSPIETGVRRIRELLPKLMTVELGYPMDDHVVNPPPSAQLVNELASLVDLRGVPEVLDLYRVCDGIDLPDVHNGYFVHPVETITRGIRRGEPVRVGGAGGVDVFVFGSDGGGGRFVLKQDGTHEVLYLPSDGGVRAAVFDPTHAPVRFVASGLDTFLTRLADDVEAFVEHREGWEYMS